jgi:hypothetical protein
VVVTRAEAAEAAIPETGLVPVALGNAQRCAGDWNAENDAIRARKQFGALLHFAQATLAALRKVAEMPCTAPGSARIGLWEDCRQREREARSKLTPENQRTFWCPRCVAADALEHLPE